MGPVWITAIAGLITALVGALVVLGIDAGDTEPEVGISEARSTGSSLTAEGDYAGLVTDAQTVVLLVRLAGSSEPWTAIDVQRAPTDEDGGGVEAGDWTVDAPVGGGTYEVHVVVVPARRGGSFETVRSELSDSGPEAEAVLARSEAITVEGS